MSIHKALKKEKRQRYFGIVLMFISLILIIFGLLKTLYRLLLSDETAFSSITNSIAALIDLFYQFTQFLIFGWFWEIAPTIDLSKILSTYNLKFLACISLLGLGMIMRDSARKLSERLNRTIERAEERGWEKEITGEQDNSKTIMQLEFKYRAEERWQTRPMGILFLAIIAGYVVSLLAKITGLNA